jgi:eukaryotic-like serine/threonine-protein kinase
MQCPTCQNEVDESQRFCPGCGTVLQASGAQAPDPMLGQVMGGKYRVVRLLGEGGMGAVYEGEQQLGTTKRKVAVKTLHPHLSRDEKVKARFEREVGTVAELQHPNTIQVYDFGATPDGILYIVMEFLEGKSLADLLEKGGAMAPERVKHIMEQVCGSLEEAHTRGIVHRDLKPDNVVLVERAGKKDFVKVLDFGIAKRSKEEDKNEQKLTQQGMVLGTPPYMSPEQFTGRPIDARSDIYSLAVMAYEMLTGRLPFQAETAWEWATQHMTQPPIPMESLPEGQRVPAPMRNAVARSLAKSPDERFQTVQDFSAAFSGAVPVREATAPLAAPPSLPERQRTELGQPLDVAAAFGPPQQPIGMPAPMMSPMGPQAMGGAPLVGQVGQAYTPAQGNVAYPTPAGFPPPPARESGGGGGRTVLLVVAGIVGVASVVAIVFAVRGSGSGNAVQFQNTIPSSAPTTVLTPVATATQTTAPPATGTGAEVPPLVGTVHPTAVPPHPTTTQPTATATAKYDGPECQRARTMRSLGHPKEAEQWGLRCIAKGGNPN